MGQLFGLLYRYHVLLLFVFLQVVALLLLVRYNSTQSIIFSGFTDEVTGSVADLSAQSRAYLTLSSQNEVLIQENARLKQELANLPVTDTLSANDDSSYLSILTDSIHFQFLPARVVYNTTTGKQNYITLALGKALQREERAGIIGERGVAGVALRSSAHYTHGLSIFHPAINVPAVLPKYNVQGVVAWQDKTTGEIALLNIPVGVPVQRGDTVLVSAYSKLFPPNTPIGTVLRVQKQTETAFQGIKLKPIENLSNLKYAYLVLNKNLEELDSLQQMPGQ